MRQPFPAEMQEFDTGAPRLGISYYGRRNSQELALPEPAPGDYNVMRDQPGFLEGFLSSRYSALITHSSLLILLLSMFALLLRVPFWAALLPCAMIHHRIGILLHEYVHGIPFRKYKQNLWVLSLFDGLLLSFGMLEMFRVTHLGHHRWVNTPRDPAMQAEHRNQKEKSLWNWIGVLEGPQQLSHVMLYFRGQYPQVKNSRFLSGAAQSLGWVALWIYAGVPAMIWKLLVLTVCTSVASSLRGAVEHHGPSTQTAFSNEYKVWIPLFGLNRHVDHHLNPTRPWYRLRFRTEKPLSPLSYWTYWYHVYVKRDYGLLPPPAKPHSEQAI